jgi:hypothetical protein
MAQYAAWASEFDWSVVEPTSPVAGNLAAAQGLSYPRRLALASPERRKTRRRSNGLSHCRRRFIDIGRIDRRPASDCPSITGPAFVGISSYSGFA